MCPLTQALWHAPYQSQYGPRFWGNNERVFIQKQSLARVILPARACAGRVSPSTLVFMDGH